MTKHRGLLPILCAAAAMAGCSDKPVQETAPPSISITVSPRTATVGVGQSMRLAASISGTDNVGVAWSVAEAAGGRITTDGTFTASGPAGIYNVVATSTADPTRSDRCQVTVTPGPQVVVAVTPSTRSMLVGEAAQFSATVDGTASTVVTWSVAEAGGGAIGSGGIYTAPTTPGIFHVVATSRADPARSGSAAVTVTAPAIDLASQLAMLSTKGLLFGHQSVGNQILAAVGDLLASNSGSKPTLVQNARSAPLIGKGIWGDFGVGANAYPVGKIDDFVAVMSGDAGAKVDIAFMKFCFVDFYDSAPYWSSGTVDTLFAKYQSAMAAVRAAHPNVAIVHFTIPLVNASFAWTNDRREAMSRLIRNAYAGREPVFDIAAVESTRPDGTRCLDGGGVPLLCAEYSVSGDDGHLNATAKPIVARALVSFLASLP